MDFLLVTFGTAGDIYPYLAIGRSLRARGHAVALATHPHWEATVRDAGLDFIPLPVADKRAGRPPAAGWASRGVSRLLHPLFRGWRKLGRASTVLPMLRPVYDAIATRHRPGKTVVAASSMALGARVAQEALGVPLATIHLAPVWLRSAHRPPLQPPFALPRWAPRPAWDAAYRCLDRFVLDPMLAPGINHFRAERGLRPVRRVFDAWRHSPERAIGLFPPWFAPPQADWPAQVRLTGFPLFDQVGPASPEVEEFLDRGDPPLVFTGGSERRDVGRFFAAAAGACAEMGRRGLLLTRYPDQVPERLPAGVRHVAYLPFSAVLPRAAALVHHGGIGTTSQALAAGVPQLVLPRRHDQHDNASRLVDLGVGRPFSPKDLTSGGLAGALSRLLACPAVAEACRSARARLRSEAPLERTCDLLEGLGGVTRAAA